MFVIRRFVSFFAVSFGCLLLVMCFPSLRLISGMFFKSTCAALGLSERYVPHSLRHGGATRLHLQGVSIEDILLRGRWPLPAQLGVMFSLVEPCISVQVPARLQDLAAVVARWPLLSLSVARSLSQSHK